MCIRDRDYFVAKWGSDGSEGHVYGDWKGHGTTPFPVPFADRRFGLYIDPRVRSRPYGPGHDRNDHDIVKV